MDFYSPSVSDLSDTLSHSPWQQDERDNSLRHQPDEEIAPQCIKDLRHQPISTGPRESCHLRR